MNEIEDIISKINQSNRPLTAEKLDYFATELLINRKLKIATSKNPEVLPGAALQYSTPDGPHMKKGYYVLSIDPKNKSFVVSWTDQKNKESFGSHHFSSFVDAVFEFWHRVRRHERTRPDYRGSYIDTLHPGSLLAKLVTTAKDSREDMQPIIHAPSKPGP